MVQGTREGFFNDIRCGMFVFGNVGEEIVFHGYRGGCLTGDNMFMILRNLMLYIFQILLDRMASFLFD